MFAKVMFLQVSVCPQGGMHGRGRVAGGHVWPGGHACWGVWQGGMCGDGGGCAWQGGMPPGRYYWIRSMRGRYASYWNAFLCVFAFGYYATNTAYVTKLNFSLISRRVMFEYISGTVGCFSLCLRQTFSKRFSITLVGADDGDRTKQNTRVHSFPE